MSKKFIYMEYVYEMLCEELCGRCEFGEDYCPAGCDILDNRCVEHEKVSEVYEIIDRANEEIQEAI